MSRRIEAIFTAAIAAAAAALAIATPQLTGGWPIDGAYHERAGFFPLLALALVLGAGAWTAWQAWHGAERDSSDELDVGGTSVLKALGGIALMSLYVGLALLIGYAVATLCVTFLLARWAGLRSRAATILAVLVCAALYMVFVVGFRVWFPPSLAAQWLS